MAVQSPTVDRWEQRVDYQEAIRRQPRAGDPTSYDVAREVGEGRPNDVTDFHVGQAHWAEDNLPDIIYELEPPPEWHDFKNREPGFLMDPNGNPVDERWPRPGEPVRKLRNLPILPNRIGTQERAWWMEAVRRLDPRVEWEDILMRMQPDKTGNLIRPNSLNTQVGRWRKIWKVLSWVESKAGNSDNQESRKIVFDNLTPQMKLANSTRGLTPGLINPSMGEAGGRVPFPNSKPGRRRLVPPKGKEDVTTEKRKRVKIVVEKDNEDDNNGDEGEDGEDGQGLAKEPTVSLRRDICAPIADMLPRQQLEAAQRDHVHRPRRSAISTAPDFKDTPEGRAVVQQVRAKQNQGRRRGHQSASQSSSRPSQCRRRSHQEDASRRTPPTRSAPTDIMWCKNDVSMSDDIPYIEDLADADFIKDLPAIALAGLTPRPNAETNEQWQRGLAHEHIVRGQSRKSTHPTVPQQAPQIPIDHSLECPSSHFSSSSMFRTHQNYPSVESALPIFDNTTPRLTSHGIPHNIWDSPAIVENSSLDPQLLQRELLGNSSITMPPPRKRTADAYAPYVVAAEQQCQLSSQISSQSVNEQISRPQPLMSMDQTVRERHRACGPYLMPPALETTDSSGRLPASIENAGFKISTSQFPFGSHIETDAQPYTNIDQRDPSVPLTGTAAARAVGRKTGPNGIPLPHDTSSFRRPLGDARDEIWKRREQLEGEHWGRFTRWSATAHNVAEKHDPSTEQGQREGDEVNKAPIPWIGLNRPWMWRDEDAEGEDEDEYDASK